jgi:MFS family permease
MLKRILRNRSLLILGISESVSGIGNWITMLAVFALVIFRGDGSVAQSSGIFLAGLLPTLLASPLAGWLCDHFNRKWLMITSELVSGLVVTGLIFTNRLELIYALLALQAIPISIMTPARQAVVPDIVAREDLTRANAFLQQLAGIIKIGAPMLAGLVLAVMSPHSAIVLDVISFALSAAILSRLPSLPPHRRLSPADARDAEEGSSLPVRTLTTVLRESSPLRLLFMLIFLGIVVIIGFDVLAPVFTRDILQANEELFGLLIGLIGMGTVGATTMLLVRQGDHNPWRDVVLGIILLASIPASLALATSVTSPGLSRALVAAGCLVGGIGNGLVTVQVGTLLQLLSPPALLGRIGGAFQSTAVAGQLIGLLATPILVPSLLSLRAYFSFATLALALLILYAVVTLHTGLGASWGVEATAEPGAGQAA